MDKKWKLDIENNLDSIAKEIAKDEKIFDVIFSLNDYGFLSEEDLKRLYVRIFYRLFVLLVLYFCVINTISFVSLPLIIINNILQGQKTTNTNIARMLLQMVFRNIDNGMPLFIKALLKEGMNELAESIDVELTHRILNENGCVFDFIFAFNYFFC